MRALVAALLLFAGCYDAARTAPIEFSPSEVTGVLRSLCWAEEMEQPAAQELAAPFGPLADLIVDDDVLCMKQLDDVEWIYTPLAEEILRDAWRWEYFSATPSVIAMQLLWCDREFEVHDARMWLAANRLPGSATVTAYLVRESEHTRQLEQACVSH